MVPEPLSWPRVARTPAGWGRWALGGRLHGMVVAGGAERDEGGHGRPLLLAAGRGAGVATAAGRGGERGEGGGGVLVAGAPRGGPGAGRGGQEAAPTPVHHRGKGGPAAGGRLLASGGRRLLQHQRVHDVLQVLLNGADEGAVAGRPALGRLVATVHQGVRLCRETREQASVQWDTPPTPAQAGVPQSSLASPLGAALQSQRRVPAPVPTTPSCLRPTATVSRARRKPASRRPHHQGDRNPITQPCRLLPTSLRRCRRLPVPLPGEQLPAPAAGTHHLSPAHSSTPARSQTCNSQKLPSADLWHVRTHRHVACGLPVPPARAAPSSRRSTDVPVTQGTS